MTHRPPRPRLHRAAGHRPRGDPPVLRGGLRLAVQRLRPGLRRASAPRTVRARSAGSTPRPRRRRAGRWCCSSPTTSTRASPPYEAAGGEVVGGALRVPRRPAVPLRRPQRQRAGGLGGAREPRTSGRGPGLRRARRHERPAGGPLERIERGSRRCMISEAETAAPSSASATSTTASATSARPASSTQRAGTPAGAGSGARRVPVRNRSAASGRHRATSSAASASAASIVVRRSARSASPTSGSCRGRRGQHAPGHDLLAHVRHQRESGLRGHDGLAVLQRRAR